MRIHEIFIIFFLIFGCCTAYSQPRAQGLSEKIVINNSSVDRVIKMLADYSGYSIELDGYYDKSNISGIFYLDDVENSLRRMFKGTDIFIEFLEKKHRILVKFPGLSAKSDDPEPGISPVDFDSGLTHDEMLAMRQREKQIQLERMNDPNQVDPESGIPYVEQLAMRQREQQIQLERMNDPNQIDPESGISYVKQRDMRQREQQIQLERMSDPNQIDPELGISYEKQRAMREREAKAQLIRMTDPAEIDPEAGIPYVKQ